MGLCVCFALLCASQSPLDDQVRGLWLVLTYPVTKAWLALLRTLEGDRGMMFIVPMLASQVFFVVMLGFVVGALLSTLLGTGRAEPAASSNGGPTLDFGKSEGDGGPPAVN